MPGIFVEILKILQKNFFFSSVAKSILDAHISKKKCKQDYSFLSMKCFVKSES